MMNNQDAPRIEPIQDERTQKVLRGIIDNYIQYSEPVGSRTLSKSLDIQLSPATIRNIMSDLSEQGYLMQPHTSGGRIPTDKAYRFYVDSLAVANSLSEEIQKRLEEVSHIDISKVEELLTNTTRTLAGLTNFICLVTAPKEECCILRRIEFIKVSNAKVLVILITKTGIVRNKVIESSEDLSQEFLNSVSHFLNEQFHDASLLEIRERVLQSMMEDKDRYDELLAHALRLGKKAFDIEPPELFMEGQMNLLIESPFRDQEALRQLVSTFEQKSRLIEVLDNTLDADGIQIFIGIENKCDELKGCSLITASYGSEDHILGTIGVIGPTSMDYQRIIPVVDYTAKILSQAMSYST